MNARLVLVQGGGGAGRVFPIVEASTTIGRAPNNTIQLPSTHVSRHHAVIEMGGSTCEIVDLDSTNGTHVNGRRIDRHATNVLENGAMIRLGDCQFRFEVESGGRPQAHGTEVHELSARTIQQTVLKGDTTITQPVGLTSPQPVEPAPPPIQAPASPPEGAASEK